MAHIKMTPGRKTYPFIYNVTMTVGSRKSVSYEVMKKPDSQYLNTTYTASFEPNKPDDVMLVQYLLKRIYQRGMQADPQLLEGNNCSSRPSQLKIDGHHGPKTQGAIETFQLDRRRQGFNIATDGCVDTELGDDTTSSISKTKYTISALNFYFWKLYPELAPNIALDPECPPELRLALSNGSW